MLDYETTMEVPSARQVPDREHARRIRAKVKHRTLAVLQAVMAEQANKIYKAELRLELSREGAAEHTGRSTPATGGRRVLAKDDAKKLPGSGLLPGTTYWDWMKTFNDKDDEQWAQEKVTVEANIAAVQRGKSDG